ncbi:MAG: DUF1801 domain-containing protein [Chitinophagales bacterium]|nr:DUF1801 domain-containing protein [Chitinophagales bacterium]
MIASVDEYLEKGCFRCKLGGTPDCKVHTWTEELKLLRAIALETELTETIKWSIPCYTYKGKNVLCIAAFKNFCSISFFKGVLLKDSKKLLVKAGENTQANRLLKVTTVDEILKIRATIKAYINEAIALEKNGQQVEFKKTKENIPVELAEMFKVDKKLETAFYALTPGKQRGYLLYFNEPKQSKTKVARIEKSIEKILNNEGLHDQYKNCK